jgi:hypothetical protein
MQLGWMKGSKRGDLCLNDIKTFELFMLDYYGLKGGKLDEK